MNMGDDTAEKFLDPVLASATMCREHLANKAPMKRLTLEKWKEYNNFMNWWICAKPFKSADNKIRDHEHLTGEYRRQAHNTCSLNYHIDLKKVKIWCIIHKLKGILLLCYSYFHIC